MAEQKPGGSLKARARRRFLFAASAVLVIAWALCTTFFGRAILGVLDRSVPRVAFADCPQADAIAVLSGDGAPRVLSLDRLPASEKPNRSEAGLELALEGRAPNLIFTAGGHEGNENRDAAIRAGVPPERILVAGPAFNTADEARLIAEALQAKAWHRLILVTSAYHITRAKLLIENEAAKRRFQLVVIAFPADSGKFFLPVRGINDFVPGWRGWERSSRAIREFAGEWTCRAGICE